MSLHKYKQKRKFDKTPEPSGKKHKKGKKLRFVIQKHHASRLHYDFRLEMEGVLKSWAVPKGPSLDPNEKRLAVMVEDHPYDYRNFEGVIPEGNYGAGKVIVWDEGTYEPFEEGEDQEKTLLAGLKKGDLKFILHGKKLQGAFVLVKFKNETKNWMLIKKKDEYISKKDILEEAESVKSGKDVEEVDKKTTPAMKKEIKEGKRTSMPHEIKPMLATLAEFPFNDENWIFEVKWDGYRAIAEIEKGNVRLYSRNNQDFNNRYSQIVSKLEKLPYKVVLDGEVVVLDGDGKSHFQLLQDYGANRRGTLAYYVFDILYLEGYDLRDLPLIERKKLLKQVLPKDDDCIRYSDHIETYGLQLYELAQEKNLEGIMAKRKNSRYVSTRSSEWLKVKHIQTQEAIICGFTEPKGKREEFGALILGVYDNGELRYIGHTGGGFDRDKLEMVRKKLTPLITKESPFVRTPKTNTPATWVKPKLVCQVKFNEWTNEGLMRQPIFLGLREDKKAKDVGYEIVSNPVEKKPRKYKAKKESKEKLKLTNLQKVYWPEDNYTKGDLIEYYDSIADYILPYLKDRPQSLNRHPNGIHGENFFQKDLVQAPDWVTTIPIHSESEDKDIHWLICNDKDTLLYMANLGCIEINPWNSHYPKLDNPDYLIIDLDPNGISFKEVIRTAECVKEIMDKADIDCFLKTSGKTGLHILVPLKAKYNFDQTRQFAEILANTVYRELPEITSVVRDPKKRQKKIYIDFLQNRIGQTIAAPYCVRPARKAPVSTPLDWKELDKDLSPTDFTIKNILQRLKKKGDIWEEFRKHKGINMLKSLEKLHSTM